MAIKVAINGFGRIGRLAFRRCVESGKFEVVAINDLVEAKTLAYLLKYDTTHGGFMKDKVGFNAEKNCIVFDGKEIPILNKKDPKELEWGKYGVDIVLECTGRFKGKADAQVHIDNGAKGVVISAPSDKDTPTFVYGVNTDKLTKDMKVISGASCAGSKPDAPESELPRWPGLCPESPREMQNRSSPSRTGSPSG